MGGTHQKVWTWGGIDWIDGSNSPELGQGREAKDKTSQTIKTNPARLPSGAACGHSSTSIVNLLVAVIFSPALAYLVTFDAQVPVRSLLPKTTATLEFWNVPKNNSHSDSDGDSFSMFWTPLLVHPSVLQSITSLDNGGSVRLS